jgi:hypothetical protein
MEVGPQFCLFESFPNYDNIYLGSDVTVSCIPPTLCLPSRTLDYNFVRTASIII